MLGEEGIEKSDEEHNGNCEESSVPSFVDIAVIVEDNKTLNLGGCQKASNRDAALPTERAKPSDDEGEEPLMTPWCKFGDPVILAAYRSVRTVRSLCDRSKVNSPAVGAMEAISAIEMLTRVKKITTMMYRYIRPAVPPFPR